MGFFSRLFSFGKETPAEPVKTPDEKVVRYKVAGTSYRQEALQAMGEKNPDYKLTKRELIKRWPDGVTVYEYKFYPQKAELVPEPENPEDPKAIKVLVDGVHVGYIKASYCPHIHKLIRENRIVKIEPKIFGGGQKTVNCWDEYGRMMKEMTAYDMEKFSNPFDVCLYITELPAAEKVKK